MSFKRWFRKNSICCLFGVVIGLWVLNFIPHISSNESSEDIFHEKRIIDNVLVIKQKDGLWIDDSIVCRTNETFKETWLKTPKGDVSLNMYEPEVDVWISGYIDKDGSWEGDLVNVVYHILKGHPDWVFVDIGANIGVYTISMAKAGIDVVAIEPLLSNVQRLCRSVKSGNLNGSVKIIHNAVSDSRRVVALGMSYKNMGGTYVMDTIDESFEGPLEQTVLLDDLLMLLKGKTVVIKMDVEQHEDRVLKGAERFFKEVDVRYLLMELKFGVQRFARDVVRFLGEQNMIPILPTKLSSTLDPRYLQDWPSDVMWEKLPD